MKTHHFTTPFSAEKIDDTNGIIRGVSVITKGIAKGHDLEVDDQTLSEMKACADERGTVPCKIDHRSGAASIAGYLTNFRIADSGHQLLADWFVLDSLPQRNQILEVARRMPEGVGLSASFLSPENSEPGKARCEELISVDYVTTPATNAGLFSIPEDDARRPLTGVEKVHRVISCADRGAGIGAGIGALGSLALRNHLKRRSVLADGATATAVGAGIGAVAGGAYQRYKDKDRKSPRDLAARVTTILLQERQDRATVNRVIDATEDSVNVPGALLGENQARTIARVVKKPLVRAAALRALKIAAGAGAGYYVGRRYGAKAGAGLGAVAGALFSAPSAVRTVSLSNAYANKVTAL